MSFEKLTLHRFATLVPLFAASIVLASCSQPQNVPAPITLNGNAVTTSDAPAPASSQPETPPPPVNSGHNESATTISGYAMTTDGQPAPGVTIEFKSLPYCFAVCHQPHIATDSSGGYSINLDDGVYNALCITDGSNYDECGPYGGDGGPFPVQVPPSDQKLDFIVCGQSDYPACLTPG